MRSPNFFASAALDRVTHLRADVEWLRAQIEHPETVFLPVWRTRNLVIEGETPRAARFTGEAARPLRDAAPHVPRSLARRQRREIRHLIANPIAPAQLDLWAGMIEQCQHRHMFSGGNQSLRHLECHSGTE
jgi:hypothetical protein